MPDARVDWVDLHRIVASRPGAGQGHILFRRCVLPGYSNSRFYGNV